jgi:YgiT-type zinc finger domain-containing protein
MIKPVQPFDQCPICAGDLVKKRVEKILRGGNHTGVVKVEAYVCQHCGERIYPQNTVRRFEEIRSKLARQETSGFRVLGRVFQIT